MEFAAGISLALCYFTAGGYQQVSVFTAGCLQIWCEWRQNLNRICERTRMKTDVNRNWEWIGAESESDEIRVDYRTKLELGSSDLGYRTGMNASDLIIGRNRSCELMQAKARLTRNRLGSSDLQETYAWIFGRRRSRQIWFTGRSMANVIYWLHGRSGVRGWVAVLTKICCCVSFTAEFFRQRRRRRVQ